MKPLTIRWQSIVASEGRTCDRCQATHVALEQLMPRLRAVLEVLDIEPVLDTQMIYLDTFKGDLSDSNRLWIDGKSIEDWLGAKVGKNLCCPACADAERRTLEVDGASFEGIPMEMIFEAVMVAAAEVDVSSHA